MRQSDLIAPLDQAHRDIIINEINSNIMVEAAAGSGKTSSLVSRILTMIENGILVQHIVAITFTVKAGEELKNRIRKELKQRIAGGIKRPEAASGLLPRYQQALADLDGASIGTIHAFCLQIITRFSIAMEVSPAVAIMSAQQLATYRHTLVAEMIHHFRTDAQIAPVLALLQDNPYTDLSNSDILDLLDLIDNNLLLLLDADFAQGIRQTAPALQTLRDFVCRLGALDLAAVDKPERAADITSYLAEYTAEADKPQTHLQALAHLLAFSPQRLSTNADGKIKASKTKRGNQWHQHIVETFAINDFTAYITELKTEYTQPLFAQLLTAIRDYLSSKRQERITAGALTQSDAIQQALIYLRNIKQGEHQQLHDQYRHFLIDEFQDTDAQQFEIFLRILSRHDAAGTDLDNPQIEPGSLFIVGDPKQAIYHFRGGDLSTYLSVKQEFVSKYGGLSPAETSLGVNFRTLPSILSRIDAVFGGGAGLISRGVKELVQPDYVSFDASARKQQVEQAAEHTMPSFSIIAPEPLDSRPLDSQSLNPGQGAPITLNKPELLGIEANDIAKFIHDTYRAQKTIPDENLGIHPVRYRDFAVLCPTKTEIGYVREALMALGIPFVIELKSQVYQMTEVIALLNLLRALAYPNTGTTYLVLALRSQLFGISDQELFEYKLWHKQVIQSIESARQSAFDYQALAAEEGPADSRVHTALHYCKRLAFHAQTMPLHQLIYQILEERKQYQSFPALISSFGTVIQDALEFDATHGGDLKDYLAYIDSLADDRQNKEIVFMDDDYDAVSITNFHQSKGREWPVCIIAGARYLLSRPGKSKFIDSSRFSEIRAKNPHDETFAVWNTSSICEFKMNRLSTAGFDTAQRCEDIITNAERARVLYVALTRAQYALVLTAHRPTKPGRDPEAFAYKLPQFMPAFKDAEKIDSLLIEDPYQLRDMLGIKRPLPNNNPAITSLTDYRAALEQRRQDSLESSSVVISKHDDDVSLGYREILPPKNLEQVLCDYLPSIQTRPTNPVQFGTIMHRALELSGFSLDATKQEEALTRALNEAQAEQEPRVTREDRQLLKDTLENVLAKSGIIAAARKSQEVYRELPLGSMIGGKTVRAYADLVFKNEDNTWTIADYKNSTTADTLADYYRQLWGYKQIFETATGYQVGELALIYCLGDSLDLIARDQTG